MQEKRTHTRVPAKAIHETPANGVFITKNDLRKRGEKTTKTGNAEVSPCQAVSFSLYY